MFFPHFRWLLPQQQFLAQRNELYFIKKRLMKLFLRDDSSLICWIISCCLGASFWFLNPFMSANLWKILLFCGRQNFRMKIAEQQVFKWMIMNIIFMNDFLLWADEKNDSDEHEDEFSRDSFYSDVKLSDWYELYFNQTITTRKLLWLNSLWVRWSKGFLN